jgi:hypothetical protein
MTSQLHRTDSSFPQGCVLQVGPLMPSLGAELAEVFGAVELPEGPRMGPFLTSQGSGTWQTRRAMADLVIRNLTSFLQSGRLVTPVALTARQRP